MRKGQIYLEACTRKYLWACPVQPGKLTLLTYSKHRFIYFKAQVFLALMLSHILSNEYYDTHEYYLVCVVKIKCVTVGNTVGWAGRSSRRVIGRSVSLMEGKSLSRSVRRTDSRSDARHGQLVSQTEVRTVGRACVCRSPRVLSVTHLVSWL